MFNISNKNELINEIKREINNEWLNISCYSSSDIERKLVELIGPLIQRVARDVACTAAKSIINHLYTHSEFEKDMGL